MAKYLIFRTDRIGDFIFSRIFTESIKKNNPNHTIDFVCSSYNSNYVKNFKDINKMSGLEKEVFSFDMLGEAARTPQQADDYFESYKSAIDEVGKINTERKLSNGVSIKISALHPRYEMRKINQVESELLPKLEELVLSLIHI